MAYYLALFSPGTYEAFARSDRSIAGFRARQYSAAQRVKPGDKFVCYVTRLSRWTGLLEVVDGPFKDDTPIFYPESDPFITRFHVRPLIWLPLEKAIPVHEDRAWSHLSFTRGRSKGSLGWSAKLHGSLVQLEEADGDFLQSLLRAQAEGGEIYPIDPNVLRKVATRRVRRLDKDVTVTVPEGIEADEEEAAKPDIRESVQIQALLAEIGSRMGMQIWVLQNDRSAVLAEWVGDHPPLLDRLPPNYDQITLKTMEQIDVLWLKGRAIKRAFEVEHTTSVYSSILRMADLLALQPNMDIRLHIVAPIERREKVFQELLRPVFSLLDRGPLSEICSYLSYDSVRELAQHKHLSHLSDSVIEEYEEWAET